LLNRRRLIFFCKREVFSHNSIARVIVFGNFKDKVSLDNVLLLGILGSEQICVIEKGIFGFFCILELLLMVFVDFFLEFLKLVR